jgi:hypothetical protein
VLLPVAAKQTAVLYKLIALVCILPAIVTVVVGLDYTLRGLGLTVIQLNIPRSGGWAVFVGLCCFGTGWVAKQGLTTLWKKL